MALTKNYLNKLKAEAKELQRTLPKDYRYDVELYDCHFFQGFFPELSIEECMDLAKREGIINDVDLLKYIGEKIFRT